MADQKITQLTGATSPVDTDLLETVQDVSTTPVNKKVTWATIKTFLKTYFDTYLNGKQIYHGIQTHGAVTWNNTTHVVQLAAGANTYWFQGTKYTTASAITCDLDSFVTLGATPTLYYVSFDDATGTLKASESPWDWYNNVFVATVFWNGSTGALQEETHLYNRDIPMHIWAHSTIGTRYGSGLDLTNPTTVNDALLQIETGTIWDEDHSFATGQRTTMRGWFKYDATHYTFLDYALPYLGTSGQPQYLDTDTYALTNVGASDYVCMWVYASTDIDRPIFIVPTHAATAHNTIASARAELAPTLIGMNLNSEVKLIYRFIYKGDGQFQESTDYRTTTSLAGGVSASTSAGAVSFIPSGNISANNVQNAIEELDNEKAPLRPATEKTSLVDADEVTGNDSANSFSQIRTTWTNVKSFLKTYFDTLYVSKTTYDANTILYATTDNTPVALTVGEQTVVGRATGGAISALAIDSDLSSVSANDDTVPSAKATKAMGDTKLPLAGGTMTGDIQLAENAGMALDSAGSADGKWSGIVIAGTSGYTQAFGDLVTLDKDDSRWEAVDISVAAAATGDARGLLGMVVSAGNDGQACKILLMGTIRADANFPTLTIGAEVFASTTGDITSTQPTTTDYVIRRIGAALTADEILFNPSYLWYTHT